MKWHRIKAMLLNYMYITKHSPDRLFDVFYWPLLDILIWGFMTYYIQGISEFNILTAILGGIMLWVFLWRASQDIVVYLLENYWSRSIYHLLSTPIQKSELLVSLSLLGVVRSFFAFGVMALVSYLLYGFTLVTFNLWEFILFVSILFLFAWAIGLLICALVFIFGSRVQVLAWSFIWVLQPFSCVFYPLSSIPSWAQGISKVLPTTYVFEGLRASLHGTAVDLGGLTYALIASIVFIIIAGGVAVWAMNVAKKKGSFAKPE